MRRPRPGGSPKGRRIVGLPVSAGHAGIVEYTSAFRPPDGVFSLSLSLLHPVVFVQLLRCVHRYRNRGRSRRRREREKIGHDRSSDSQTVLSGARPRTSSSENLTLPSPPLLSGDRRYAGPFGVLPRQKLVCRRSLGQRGRGNDSSRMQKDFHCQSSPWGPEAAACGKSTGVIFF